MDGEGKIAIPMAIMANRGTMPDHGIIVMCMSCFNFKKDIDQLFSGGKGKTASLRYYKRIRSFLMRTTPKPSSTSTLTFSRGRRSA